jgi:hypothetical protein
LGRAYYEIAIFEFVKQYKIDQDVAYTVQVLNLFKRYDFVKMMYDYLHLNRFEDSNYIKKADENLTKLYHQNIFYTFVYWLFDDSKDTQTPKVKDKLFNHYFLHYLSTFNSQSSINLNYKDMSLAYIKGKDITIKESYKSDETSKIVDFKLLVEAKNQEIKNYIINIRGKSIKTLRKKAYKKLFMKLIEEMDYIKC